MIWFLLFLPLLPTLLARQIPPLFHLNRVERFPVDEYDQYYDNVEIEKEVGTIKDFFPAFRNLSLTDCQHSCTKHISKALETAMKSENHYERFYGVCKKYNDTIACMNELHECGNRAMFDVMTSGLHYMCVEQRKAFTATIECIDAVSGEISHECNVKCQTQAKLANWAMQNEFIQGFQVKGSLLSRLSPEKMRNMMQEGCEVARCSLGCMKTKFNTRCGGTAGSLISEMLVRPLETIQDGNQFGSMNTIMAMLLPPSCSFAVNPIELKEFRIDPKLDQQIHRMYDNDDTSNPSVPEMDATTPTIFELPNLPTSELDYPDDGFSSGEELVADLGQNEHILMN